MKSVYPDEFVNIIINICYNIIVQTYIIIFNFKKHNLVNLWLKFDIRRGPSKRET